MLHTKNFGLLEFALQLEPTAVGLRAAAGARAQSSFLSETRGSQISPPIRTGRDDERSPAIGVQHRPEHRLCHPHPHPPGKPGLFWKKLVGNWQGKPTPVSQETLTQGKR